MLMDQILAPGGLRPVFQPIYRMNGGNKRELHSLECLIRGPRETNVECAPVLFEYVRRKRQENVVDRACVLTAFGAAAKFAGTPRIAVNAHAATLARDSLFPDFLVDAAKSHRIGVERVTVEIVEHGPALDGKSFFRTLQVLKERGISIAIDDVGVAASNLRMILECRPHYLKVDRYFVSRAHEDPGKRATLEAVMHIARRLGSTVVAEGIETREELQVVREAGIDLIQGYLFCTPLGVDELFEHEPSLRKE
ncbi:MAG TPA: EAL domain-containing protein [Myxococcales bacterium]|nr:EAL domain-containing protein [Myxococcales bacterium]